MRSWGNKYLYLGYLAVITLILAGACTGLRPVAEHEKLYTGGSLKIVKDEPVHDEGGMSSELHGLIKPKPNGKFLWMRPGLAIHNMVKEPKKEKGFNYWMKYKVGSPPVLLNTVYPDDVSATMENRLFNRGYFYGDANYKVISKSKTAKIQYKASPGNVYVIDSVIYLAGNTKIDKAIQKLKQGSLIQEGEPYSLENLKDERNRINDILKDSGYYYFNPDWLLFKVDTNNRNRTLDIEMEFKPEFPRQASKTYTLGNIFLFADYKLYDYDPDTSLINNYYFVSADKKLKPGVLISGMFMEKGQLYSRTAQNMSLRYLMSLGIYKYASPAFRLSDSLSQSLDVDIHLTPLKKKAITAELNANVKSNNYAGPGVILSYRNRNLFGGAEQFSVNLTGRFETQFKGDNVGSTSYEIRVEPGLTIPGFIPFRPSKRLLKRAPKTEILTGVGFFRRVELYSFNSFNVSYGYLWRANVKVSHMLRPIDISYTDLVDATDEFKEYLEKNPSLKKSFEEQFIIGTSYTFTYSTLMEKEKKSQYFVMGGLDAAGNLAAAITSLTQETKGEEKVIPRTIFGVPFNQYIRYRTDFRYYLNFKKDQQLVYRIFTGAGIPYGNSTTMPYIKQFFVGGTNSVRAFIARSVGPGTYKPPDSLSTIYVDQVGDIKLETNLEYRFTMVGMLKGALFVDAGNIWLINADTTRPGGEFQWDSFLSELALGTGFGIRLDVDFFVLRLDLSFPLRIPYLPEGERWVYDDMAWGSRSWRKENLIWNFSIGYPF